MLVARIERIDPGLGIETMVLIAPHVEDLQASMVAAKLGRDDHAPDLALLVDQLSGRVPPEAVFRLSSHESDVPERAIRRMMPLGEPKGWPAWARPSRLLARPEPLSSVIALLPDHPPRRFSWRGGTYQVVAGDGPERVHGEWWRRPGEMWAVRDYYRVEVERRRALWIFRRGDGVEEGTGDLSWHLHGVFG
jgi:protein ImuB